MRDCGLRPRVIRAIGGGAVSDFWLQMKADVTGLPVDGRLLTEAAVGGAASLRQSATASLTRWQLLRKRFYRVDQVFRSVPARPESVSGSVCAVCKNGGRLRVVGVG